MRRLPASPAIPEQQDMPRRVTLDIKRAARVLRSAAFGAVMLVGAAAAQAQETIAGDVRAVKVWAFGTPAEGNRRDLFLKDQVHVRELLETVQNGALHVRLADDTELRLGSATRVVLDEFVYQPEADAATVLANIYKGVARFITDKVAKKDFTVVTPSASITARGTEFSVWIGADGTTTVWVQEGQVEVTPRNGRPSALVNEGEIVSAGLTGDIDLDAPRPASDPGIAPTGRVRWQRGKNK
jgi:ferric-dicitrate binding protein FerR (iron transport regulator)